MTERKWRYDNLWIPGCDSQWKANYILYLIPPSIQTSTEKGGEGKGTGLSVPQQILTSPSPWESSLPHVDAKDAATSPGFSLAVLAPSKLENPFPVAQQFCMTRPNGVDIFKACANIFCCFFTVYDVNRWYRRCVAASVDKVSDDRSLTSKYFINYASCNRLWKITYRDFFFYPWSFED